MPHRTMPDRPAKGELRTPSSPRPCLSDDEIAAFAQGQLSQAERLRIEQHMDGCEACAALLDEVMRGLNTTLPSAVADPGTDWATTFSRGALVADRYEVRRFIARGGMGEVYEAYDRQLQERVALKTVSSSASDSPRAIRDLKAEVQLARRVTHAHVCRIYDLGTHTLKNGGVVHFLTMEFVEGETLGQILRARGALTLDRCDQFARGLLQGLAAAHAAGILHRDFKSDNVMVRRNDGGRLTPVILDFGLARHLDERSRARSSGQTMVGTLAYMAPEQVEGAPLSKATDIYAFGVVWFEMLTGKLPFANSPQRGALERLTKPPNAPSVLNREVPRMVDAAVLRCLARSPTQRFQTAQGVLDALDATPSVPLKRSPLLIMQIAAASLLLVGFVYAIGSQQPRVVNLQATLPAGAPTAPASQLPVEPTAATAFPLANSAPFPLPEKTGAPVVKKNKRPAVADSARVMPESPAAAAAPSASSNPTLPRARRWPFGTSPLEATSGASATASTQNRSE